MDGVAMGLGNLARPPGPPYQDSHRDEPQMRPPGPGYPDSHPDEPRMGWQWASGPSPAPLAPPGLPGHPSKLLA